MCVCIRFRAWLVAPALVDAQLVVACAMLLACYYTLGWASDSWSMYRVHDVTEGVETRSGGPFQTVVLHTAADRNKLYI